MNTRHFAGVAFLLFSCLTQPQFVTARAGQFDSAGQAMAYTVYGEGAPVILLHGLTGNQTKLKPLRKAFLDAGYMVIVFDSRGHGKSGKPHARDAYGTAMVEDIVRLIDRPRIDCTHVVGYSMGGDLANKLREMHPNRLLSVTSGGVGLGVTEGWSDKPFDPESLAVSLESGDGFRPILVEPGAIAPGRATRDVSSGGTSEGIS